MTAALAIAPLLLAGAVMAATSAPIGPGVPSLPLGGEFTYLADAARFTECMTGVSYPVAMEGDFRKLERAYLAAVEEPGAPLYVTLEGSLLDRPKMEGEGAERTVVVNRFINVWPAQRCEQARAEASLTNTYWRIARLGEETVSAVQGRREPHLILRADGESDRTYVATVGCNRFIGGYAAGGEDIRFAPGAVPLLPCPPPLDALERSLGAMLSRAARWRVTANTLEFFDAGGASVALFEAVYF